MVSPLVARKLISIPPALALFAIVAMVLAFGALGLLLASPLTVVLFVLVRKLYVQAALGKGKHAGAVAGAVDDRAR